MFVRNGKYEDFLFKDKIAGESAIIFLVFIRSTPSG